MNRYAIYCTEEQTKKALELGAPIEVLYDKVDYQQKVPTVSIKGEYVTYDYFIPTTEEMIGWLEEQGVLMQIEPINGMHYYWLLSTKELTEKPDRYSWVTQYVTPDYKEIPSRKEAILSAIDAALKYLINIKQGRSCIYRS